jgi:hypothetical protein
VLCMQSLMPDEGCKQGAGAIRAAVQYKGMQSKSKIREARGR